MAEGIKPIFHTLEGTGTPCGQSRIRELANGCPRRWLLQQKHPGESTKEALAVGSMLHKYMELYYRGGDSFFNSMVVRFIDTPYGSRQEMYQKEAERLFVAYQARFPVETTGKVIAVEHFLPRAAMQAKRVGDYVGFPGYTARLDLVTWIGSDELEAIEQVRDMTLPGPGYYAWDWKSAAMITKSTYDSMRESIQFKYYQMAWNAAYPKAPLRGLIACIITKTKNPRIEHVVVPAISADDEKIVRATSQRALEVLEAADFPANPDRCFDWNSTCEFWESGICQRY